MYLAYLWYILKHKRFVLLECRKLGITWLGIIHDWSKFLPSEFLPYARHFHNPDGSNKDVRGKTGYYKPFNTGDPAFDFAWMLHQKRNRHHSQWWILPDEGSTHVIPMPGHYCREMLADWRGAGRAQGTPDVTAWYLENGHKLQLHPDTRTWVERMLGVGTVSTMEIT